MPVQKNNKRKNKQATRRTTTGKSRVSQMEASQDMSVSKAKKKEKNKSKYPTC